VPLDLDLDNIFSPQGKIDMSLTSRMTNKLYAAIVIKAEKITVAMKTAASTNALSHDKSMSRCGGSRLALALPP
jgi:hypothetical protein